MKTVFALRDVSVVFPRRAIRQLSLKQTLGNLLHPTQEKPFRALANITMEIHEGEHIGIIGRNGAGKSTLLKVLTRVIDPLHGVVHSNGFRHIVPLLELGIGFHPDLSGRENCYLAGLLMGYSRQEIRSRIAGIQSFAELGDFFDEPVKNYSSGMYARLAFSLATDVEPQVLIVDEVFGVGDEFFMRKCIVRMQRLMQAGSTTVFVSHNIDFLVNQCSRLIWLDRGAIAMDGPPAEVGAAYRACGGSWSSM